MVVAGQFESSVPNPRSRIARLNADGTLDSSFDTPGMNGPRRFVEPVALKANGKVVVGGEYDTVAGAPAESVVQLNSNGSRDGSFQSNGPGTHAQVNAIVRQAGGKLLVGFSSFMGSSQHGAPPQTKVNGTRLGGIGRLNVDGTTDNSFMSPFDDSIVQLHRAPIRWETDR